MSRCDNDFEFGEDLRVVPSEITTEPGVADEARKVAGGDHQIEHRIPIGCRDRFELALQPVHLALHAGHLLCAETADLLRAELSPNFGDGLKDQAVAWVWRRGRIAEDLDPVGEPHTPDQFWQLVMAVDAASIFLRAFDKLEDHGKRGLVRQAAF